MTQIIRLCPDCGRACGDVLLIGVPWLAADPAGAAQLRGRVA
ncbi:MAG: hypothetical protein ACRDNZ_20330 [Streptosporangiaceae bacterium]